MVAEPGPDAPVPQMAEQFMEVPKIVPQDRILQQTVEQFVDRSEAKRANLAKAEKSLAAWMASQAAGKSSCNQVALDHLASVKVIAEKLKAWTEATKVLQSERDGTDGRAYSLFQENSSAALQTSSDFKGFDMMTAVRRLAEQEHFAALAQPRSRISAITKFGADADNDPFVKVKDLITDLIRLHTEASPETNQKSHCDEETSKATKMKQDLGAEVGKHSSKLETAVVEERDLLSAVYKNAVDSRRAVWRVITSIEQKEKSKSEEQLASYAREYVAKVENELQKIREGVLALTDKKLIRSPSTDESKAFYYKMKSDCYRYLAEFATGETKSKAGEDARDACVEANKIAENDLAVTHPVRLAMDTKFVQSLKTRCSETNEEFDRRVVDRQTELKAVIDAMNKVVDDPVVQVPQIEVVEKTVEGPQLQIVEQVVETPETQTIQGIQTSENLDTAPLRQMHPTDVVKPDDPDAQLKFLVKEVLHGVGGFVFDANGNRVANEMGGPPFSHALEQRHLY